MPFACGWKRQLDSTAELVAVCSSSGFCSFGLCVAKCVIAFAVNLADVVLRMAASTVPAAVAAVFLSLKMECLTRYVFLGLQSHAFVVKRWI